MKTLSLLLLLLPSLTVNASNIIKVAILDSGINNQDGRYNNVLCSQQKDFTGEGMDDKVGHGTAIAGLIKKYADGFNYCLLIAKYYVVNDDLGSARRLVSAMQWASDQGAEVINLSGGGYGYSRAEDLFIRNHPDITFFVAAGNDKEALGREKCRFYPACLPHPNILVVGALNASGDQWQDSNYGEVVDFWELGENVPVDGGMKYMTGTSASTAISVGKYLSLTTEEER